MRDDDDNYSSLDFLNFIPTAEPEDDEPCGALTFAEPAEPYSQGVEEPSATQRGRSYDSNEIALLDAAECVKPCSVLENAARYSCYLPPSFDTNCCAAPVVQNIVASVHLGQEVDLREIAISTRNAEYNPRKFNALILRLHNPRCTGLVFRTGRLMVTGSKTVECARLGAKRMAKMIRRELGVDLRFREFKIENIIATFNCNVPIRLERLYEEHKLFCNYEPEIFAGLVYRFSLPDTSEAVLLIFVSGNVIVTGCRSPKEIQLIYAQMAPFLREFKQ
ncbi:TATA-box-binding protein [Babesia caballi]|uniref:TATA-box-binding protein n=1 Tax=Babesia caballi TaxID=5871 RepID=A0AAV4M0E3_BABCB|nr:TATA-box-binding protein [Babesia caballi]